MADPDFIDDCHERVRAIYLYWDGKRNGRLDAEPGRPRPGATSRSCCPTSAWSTWWRMRADTSIACSAPTRSRCAAAIRPACAVGDGYFGTSKESVFLNYDGVARSRAPRLDRDPSITSDDRFIQHESIFLPLSDDGETRQHDPGLHGLRTRRARLERCIVGRARQIFHKATRRRSCVVASDNRSVLMSDGHRVPRWLKLPALAVAAVLLGDLLAIADRARRLRGELGRAGAGGERRLPDRERAGAAARGVEQSGLPAPGRVDHHRQMAADPHEGQRGLHALPVRQADAKVEIQEIEAQLVQVAGISADWPNSKRGQCSEIAREAGQQRAVMQRCGEPKLPTSPSAVP